MNNKDLIENYQHKLAELDKQYWFEDLPLKEFIVKSDGIIKRMNELENETRGNTIWQKIKVFAGQQKKKISKIIARCRTSWSGSQNIHN